MAHRIRLGELLVKAGVLEEIQLQTALNEQRKWGGQIGKILVDLGFVDEAVIVRALSKQLGLPRARLDTAEVPAELLRALDVGAARAKRYCPERVDPARKLLTIAMADPTDVAIVDDLAFRTGYRIETTIAGETEVARAIDRLFFGRVEEPIEVELDRSPVASSGPGSAERGPFREIDPRQLGEVQRPAPAPAAPRPPAPERFAALEPPESAPLAPASSLGPLSGGEPRPRGAELGPPSAPPVWGEPSTVGTDPDQAALRLEAAQKRQNRAIRAMLDLLIERGVFTEDDFRARLGSARPRSKR